MKTGWVWIPGDKGRWRPFIEFRQIQKGKNRGKVEVTLPAQPSRRIVVEASAIKSYPVAEPVEEIKEVTGENIASE